MSAAPINDFDNGVAAANFKTTAPDMRAHALDYAGKSWPVFPCNPMDKHPLTPHGFKDATTDADQIEAWWKRWPNAMIGSPMGSATGIIAIDPDVPDEPGGPNGLAHWIELQKRHGEVPPTRTHVTPSGGRHVLFAWDASRPLTNKEGDLKGTGINVRGEGGYVIMPPSRRADGVPYELERPALADTIVAPPRWLVDLIDPPKSAPTTTPSISARAQALVKPPIDFFGRHAAYAAAALDGEIRAVEGAPKGGRNNQLNEAAFKLGTLIGAGVLDRREVEIALINAAHTSGIVAEDGERAVMATIQSGLGAGALYPRQLPEPGTANGDAAYGRSIVEAFISSKQVNENQEAEGGTRRPEGLTTASPYGRWHGERRNERGNWLIKHFLSETGLALLAGQSGAGKTFLAIDLAGSLATGADFFGKRVKRRCGTLFLVGEGEGTMQERIDAMVRGRFANDPPDGDGPADFPVVWRPVSGLKEPKVVDEEIRAAKFFAEEMQTRHGLPLGLIVVDTIAATFGFDDENAASEATRAMQALQRLSIETGALVIGIAHHGKDASTGVRGSSAFTASADVILAALARVDGEGKVTKRQVALHKTRRGETGWCVPFHLRRTDLGTDEDGEDVWSRFVEPALDEQKFSPDAGSSRLPEGVRKFKEALAYVLASDKAKRVRPFGYEGPEVRAAAIDDVRDEFYARVVEDKGPDAKRKAFQRARSGAEERRIACHREINGANLLWFVSKADEAATWGVRS
jgi:hypothetical protein